MRLLLLAVVASLLMGVHSATVAAKTATITEWFNPKWDKLSGDPSNWTDDVKTRVVMVAAGTAAVSALGASIGMAGAVAILLFGIPNLNWTIVLAMGFMFYAYKKKHKLLLIAGGWVGYCYFKGYSPML